MVKGRIRVSQSARAPCQATGTTSPPASSSNPIQASAKPPRSTAMRQTAWNRASRAPGAVTLK